MGALLLKVDLNMKKLDAVIRSLESPPKIKLGILGSNSRKNSGTTNAAVGAAHEYGTKDIPQRSFLRMPISFRYENNLRSSGAFDPGVMDSHLASGDMRQFIEKMAIVAKATVLEAFDTGGFGQWQPLSDKTLDQKKTKQILVETQQLRNSISYEIEG